MGSVDNSLCLHSSLLTEHTFAYGSGGYPRQICTVLIWGSDRFRFGIPEKTYSNKRICVTGAIASYRGTPEIIANAPSQIRVTNE